MRVIDAVRIYGSLTSCSWISSSSSCNHHHRSIWQCVEKRTDQNQGLDVSVQSLRVFLAVALLVVTFTVASVVLLTVRFTVAFVITRMRDHIFMPVAEHPTLGMTVLHTSCRNPGRIYCRTIYRSLWCH